MTVIDDALNEIIENKFNHKNLPAFIDNLGVPFEQLEQILLKLARLRANESILYKFIKRNFFELINREELKLIEDPVLRRLYIKAIQEKLSEDAYVYFITKKITTQLSKIQTEYKEVKSLIINTSDGNVWKLAKLTSVGTTLILTKEASSILLKILLMQGDFTGIKLKGNKDKFFKDIITSLSMNNNVSKLRPFVLLNILDKFGPTDQKLKRFLEIFKPEDSRAKKNIRLLKFLLSNPISKRRKLVKKFIMRYNKKNEQTQTGQCSAE
jgi:hypothetical protein